VGLRAPAVVRLEGALAHVRLRLRILRGRTTPQDRGPAATSMLDTAWRTHRSPSLAVGSWAAVRGYAHAPAGSTPTTLGQPAPTPVRRSSTRPMEIRSCGQRLSACGQRCYRAPLPVHAGRPASAQPGGTRRATDEALVRWGRVKQHRCHFRSVASVSGTDRRRHVTR
jgi:hypothetical protein